MICDKCGLPKFVGPAGYAGPQCMCGVSFPKADFTHTHFTDDATLQRIADLETKLADSEDRASSLTKDLDLVRQTSIAQAEAFGKVLAAHQAREKMMREALERIDRREYAPDQDEWSSTSHNASPGDRARQFDIQLDHWNTIASEALALHTDDTALREYVAKELEKIACELKERGEPATAEFLVKDRAEEIRSGK